MSSHTILLGLEGVSAIVFRPEQRQGPDGAGLPPVVDHTATNALARKDGRLAASVRRDS